MIRNGIRNRIADLGLSQKEVSAQLGQKEQNFSSFLCGNRAFSMRKLIKLMELLGLSVGDPRNVVGKYPPNEIYHSIAERMAERGLNIKELANSSNVNKSSLSLFLRGSRMLELASLERVLTTLGFELVSYGRPKIL